MSVLKSQGAGVKGIILFYSVMTVGLGLIDIVLLRKIDDNQKSDSSEKVNLKMLTKPLRMPAVWLMIGIIFATLTISTGYYYISPLCDGGVRRQRSPWSGAVLLFPVYPPLFLIWSRRPGRPHQ